MTSAVCFGPVTGLSLRPRAASVRANQDARALPVSAHTGLNP